MESNLSRRQFLGIIGKGAALQHLPKVEQQDGYDQRLALEAYNELNAGFSHIYELARPTILLGPSPQTHPNIQHLIGMEYSPLTGNHLANYNSCIQLQDTDIEEYINERRTVAPAPANWDFPVRAAYRLPPTKGQQFISSPLQMPHLISRRPFIGSDREHVSFIAESLYRIKKVTEIDQRSSLVTSTPHIHGNFVSSLTSQNAGQWMAELEKWSRHTSPQWEEFPLCADVEPGIVGETLHAHFEAPYPASGSFQIDQSEKDYVLKPFDTPNVRIVLPKEKVASTEKRYLKDNAFIGGNVHLDFAFFYTDPEKMWEGFYLMQADYHASDLKINTFFDQHPPAPSMKA